MGVAVVLLHEAAVGIAKDSRVVVGGRQDFGCEDEGVPGAGDGLRGKRIDKEDGVAAGRRRRLFVARGCLIRLYLTRMDGTGSDLLLDTEAVDAEFHGVADAEIMGWVETESDSSGCAGGNDIARKKGHEPTKVTH